MQKLNFSDLQHQKTASQITIEKICDLTGLPTELCEQKYNHLSIDMNDDEILTHFTELNKQQIGKINHQKQLVNDLINYDYVKLNESNHQQFYMDKLKLVSDEYSKMNIVKELLNNTKENDVDNMSQLFEGIQHELAHTNKFYQPDNMFSIIMENVNRIVQQNELKKVMVADDNTFYLTVLKSIFSGSNDGFYNNISTIKNTISDTQTLTFDLMLFVNQYIQTMEYDLSFINPKTVREYKTVANDLMVNIYGSAKASRLLIKGDVYAKDENKNPYNVIEQATSKLDADVFISMGVNLWNIQPKSVKDSISLIDSMKHLYKQPVSRRLISLFVTKASLLVNDVLKAHSARKMAGF